MNSFGVIITVYLTLILGMLSLLWFLIFRKEYAMWPIILGSIIIVLLL